jgi:uncharacterized protein YbjT (DUF2867 family)
MTRVALIGTTGYDGQSVCARLVADDHVRTAVCVANR